MLLNGNARLTIRKFVLWSDRTDKFEVTETGTKWIIEWNIKSHGLKALIQFIFFKIKGYKAYHRMIIEPVQEHFSNHN